MKKLFLLSLLLLGQLSAGYVPRGSVVPIATAVTTTHTITNDQAYLAVSGAGGAYNLTLPTSPVVGQRHIIRRTDNTLANAISIVGTIDGATDWKLHTINETYEIVWTGSVWNKVRHDTATPVVSTATTIYAVTTNPTKGTPRAWDFIEWWRVGRFAYLRFQYVQGGAGSAGSGVMMLPLDPLGLSLDTVAAQPYASGVSPAYALQYYSLEGLFHVGTVDGVVRTMFPVAYSMTGKGYGIAFFMSDGTHWNSGLANGNLGISTHAFQGWVKIPILGWKD